MTHSTSFSTTDHALAQRTLKRWRSGALRVLSADVHLIVTANGPQTVSVVTAAPRTDVVDLIRRHQADLDGDGDVRYFWQFCLDAAYPRQSRALVRCEFSNPAKCTFVLEFTILDMLPFLEHTCASEMMILTFGGQRGVTLTGIVVPELRDVVATARIIATLEAAR